MTTKITSANITQSGTSGISSVAWQAVQTTGFTAVAGRAYPCNTTSAAFTVTLPASPAAGNVITLTDYAGTWGTNNLTVNPNGGKINGVTANVLLSTNRGSVQLVYIDSTQGWIANSGFAVTTLPQTFSVEYLVVGGGGGSNQGGGGAGGFKNDSLTVSYSTSYTVTVGAAGAAGSGNGTVDGGNGGQSTFGPITSDGGGGGVGGPTTNGKNGASGGGGGQMGSGTSNGGSGSPPQGYNGSGNGGFNAPGYPGGAGGGAGGAATNATSTSAAGNGGLARESLITGASVYYAGGGGGGMNVTGYTPGLGGGTSNASQKGGAGNGASGSQTANAGSVNTGGGAGGTGNGGAVGGSGVVIIAYPSTYPNLASIDAGLTYTLDTVTRSGYKVYRFTAGSGNISW